MYCNSICETLYGALMRSAFHTFTVHSSFSSAVNLMGSDGLFFALLPQSKELRPFSMTVTDFDQLDLVPGKKVYVQGNALNTASIQIPIAADAPKSLKLSRHNTPVLHPHVHLLEPLMAGQAQSGFSQHALSFLGHKQVPESYSALFNPLYAALKEKSCASFARSAYGILGVGQGLTPSGDDFLCGLLLVLYQNGEDGLIKSFLSTDFAARTNQISANYLQCAAQGLAPESMGRLLHYLNQEEAGDTSALISYYFQRVSAFGATSGHDICTGIYWGLSALSALL